MYHGQLPRKATIGDIVSARGYEGTYFKVDGYSEQFHHEHGVSYNEVLYDLTDIADFMRFIVADDEDITVISAKASEPIDHVKWMNTRRETEMETNKVEEHTDEVAVATTMDELLDRYNDIKTVTAVCGTDAHYDEELAEVVRKLSEVAGG